MEPSSKKLKNQLEKQLQAVRKQRDKYERKYNLLMCAIYKLKGRCYSCEQQGSKVGSCRCAEIAEELAFLKKKEIRHE